MPINIPLHTTWQTRQLIRSLDKDLKNPTLSESKRKEAADAADNLLRHTIFPQLTEAIGKSDDTIPAPILIPSRATYQMTLRIAPDYGHGTKFCVSVKKEDTVKHLKELVEVETEVASEGQRLFFMGQEMKEEWKQIGQYGVMDGGIAEMKRRCRMEVERLCAKG